MHGIVDEWTDSDYADDPRKAAGSEDAQSSARVLRGGSWICNAFRLRSAYRVALPAYTVLSTGFVVARALHENL